MSDIYTPTTEEVRDQFSRAYWSQDIEAWAAEFDRWLAAHDKEVLEKAAADSKAAQDDAYVCGRDDEKAWAALRALRHINANNSVYDLADTHIEDIVAAVRGEGESNG
jgi:hypothetical protein